MSPTLLPPLAVAAGLLLVSGTAKLRDPSGALDGIVVGARPVGSIEPAALALRVLGAAELVLGAAVFVDPARAVDAMVAAVFAAFALVIEWQRRQPEITSCGCLGAGSAPPSLIHTALNVALAGAAGAAAWRGVPSPGHVALTAPVTFAVTLAGVATATALAAAVVRDLAALAGSYDRSAAR